MSCLEGEGFVLVLCKLKILTCVGLVFLENYIKILQ